MTKWVEDTKKEFDDETTYQVGFAPPKTATHRRHHRRLRVASD